MLNPFRCSSFPIDTSFQRQIFTTIHTTRKMSISCAAVYSKFEDSQEQLLQSLCVTCKLLSSDSICFDLGRLLLHEMYTKSGWTEGITTYLVKMYGMKYGYGEAR